MALTKKQKKLPKGLQMAILKSQKKGSKKKKGKKTLMKYHKDGDFYGGRLPLGMKRNLCNKYASNEIRIHMDDDDYYPPQSVQLRVSHLKKEIENDNHCIFCTTVPNFHVNQYKSIINNIGDKMGIDKGLSENTLTYTKEFWEKQSFNDQDLAKEGNNFIKGRLRYCKVIDYREIIVGLVHQTNFYNRIKFPEGEPNGWAFNKIPNKLFLLITSFNEDIQENK